MVAVGNVEQRSLIVELQNLDVGDVVGPVHVRRRRAKVGNRGNAGSGFGAYIVVGLVAMEHDDVDVTGAAVDDIGILATLDHVVAGPRLDLRRGPGRIVG